jgi:hypothetical protein
MEENAQETELEFWRRIALKRAKEVERLKRIIIALHDEQEEEENGED